MLLHFPNLTDIQVTKWYKNMSKARVSEVWTYFTIYDAENVNCKLCDKKYSRKGRTTSAMRNHLETKHKNEYDEFTEKNTSDPTFV